MTTGIVKTVLADRDFGFISGEDRREYFFHRMDCESDEAFLALEKGSAVAFDVMTPAPRKGPRAQKIVALVPAESQPGEVQTA